ncbi:glycosyltransferase family 39 protein [Synechococcus sp. PCC 7336]|uniref:ArnT family glycosyltransferase n=1 Tax=Synechococcus sp. PCC 7336 TaxID=195250 RepID=UPI00034CD021|nr:glycosyltransferase family 39 protein [Synechococcus sp. PCC 7336]
MKCNGGDRLWLAILTVAAVVLWFAALGDVPLRDWDEGTRALVAREMLQTGSWWFPRLHGQPYMLKPPLMDWLVALSYRTLGISEFTSRLPGALLSALGVPLLYGLGRSVFQRRDRALLSAATYLTLLPVVRHGRLLMLDGAAISGFLILLGCMARAQRHERWAIGIGLGLAGIVFMKGLLAVPLAAIAIAWAIWQQQTALATNRWFWLGIGLGLLPVLGWYGSQLWHYGLDFAQVHFGAQGFDRLTGTVESHSGPPWYYLLELLKYGWPWLLFWPSGLWLAWRERQQTWGSLVLLGTVLYLGIISAMGTKLPWYIMPIYPFFALAVGARLGDFWQHRRAYPRRLAIAFWVLALAGLGGTVYFAISGSWREWLLPLMGAMSSLTFWMAGCLLWLNRRRFVPVLITGIYAVLGILMLSDVWLWELNEAFDVRPVAAMVRQHMDAGTAIYTSFAYSRPSLDFYCNCKIIAANAEVLQQQWPTHPLLLDRAALEALELPEPVVLGTSAGFSLVVPRLIANAAE